MLLQRAFCWGFFATAKCGQARACEILADQHHFAGACILSAAVAGVAVALLAELVHPPFPTACQLGRLLFPAPPRG